MVRSTTTLVCDYVVFIAFIGVTIFVPFYTRLVEPKSNTKANYVFAAASKVSMGAMLLSFARGTLGVRSFLGYPSELYYHGSGMYETMYGMILAYPLVSYFFVPVYYSLGITSVYQYLDLRFKSQLVRCIASGTYLIRNVLTLGVTVFTPCVALKTVVGIPYWISIVGITAISIFCAIVGGLKAAILSDVIQGCVMIACSLAFIIKGVVDSGGVEQVIKSNVDRGRLIFFNFDMDPSVRVATVSAVLGQLFMTLSVSGCQQNFVQRICSMKSLKTVRRALWTIVPVIVVMFSLCWVVGMVIFADYEDCDPLKLGFTSKIDEIVPFYAQDKFMHIPGLMGLFMASLFNGALSISVSNLNSMATVFWEDFISKIPCFKKFNDKKQLLVIKMLGLIVGIITMGIAFGVALLAGVIDASQLMISSTSGPLLGVFLLAMFFPTCNWKGAAGGMLLSHAVTIWVNFASRTVGSHSIPILPLSTNKCNNDSFSSDIFEMYESKPVIISNEIHWMNGTESDFYQHQKNTTSIAEKSPLYSLYTMTYMYYSLLGCGICVVTGLLISFITGSDEHDVYDEKLIHPLALKISRLLPGKSRKFTNEPIKNSIRMLAPPDLKVDPSDTPRYTKYNEDFVPVYSSNGSSPSSHHENEAYHRNIMLHSADSLNTVSSKVSVT